MAAERKRVAVLGSTGSIGQQTLDVIAEQSDLHVCALAAGRNARLLAEQARRFTPEVVALADGDAAQSLAGDLPAGIRLLTGPDAGTQAIRATGPDVVLSGVVGAAGLEPTLAAIDCGATLAIANKETLVMAGAIVMPLCNRAGVTVLPVDSEHSAIFQCMLAGSPREVRKVVITASGGALRDRDDADIASATVEDALDHPTWSMGRKITIDSATLINKALEMIEAHWLFGLDADQIDVVIHPQSIVHSLVEFCDGSVIAQMGHPDMTLPIAYALNHPARRCRPSRPLDLSELGRLDFQLAEGRFARAIALGYEVIRRGGVTGAALNSANEAAVAAFLDGRIPFGQIVPVVEDVLNRCRTVSEVTLDALRATDAWAREEVARHVGPHQVPNSQPTNTADED